MVSSMNEEPPMAESGVEAAVAERRPVHERPMREAAMGEAAMGESAMGEAAMGEAAMGEAAVEGGPMEAPSPHASAKRPGLGRCSGRDDAYPESSRYRDFPDSGC
jgi:hypothetical protein